MRIRLYGFMLCGPEWHVQFFLFTHLTVERCPFLFIYLCAVLGEPHDLSAGWGVVLRYYYRLLV